MKRYKVLFPSSQKAEYVWGDYNLKTKVIDYFTNLSMTKKVDVSGADILEIPIESYFDIFGLECGQYWFPLIQPIIDYIDEYNSQEENKEKIIIKRISSQNRQLDVQLNFRPLSLENIINDAITHSKDICEFCGASNSVKQP
jgi:hypothetical protein